MDRGGPGAAADAGRPAIRYADGQDPIEEHTVSATTDPKREFLRHAVATLAYRGGKVLRDVPDNFASFRVGETTRTPSQILAHVGDLLDWAVSLATGKEEWHDATPLPWREEVARFYDALNTLDTCLASDTPLGRPCEQIFQGPVADALALRATRDATTRRLNPFAARTMPPQRSSSGTSALINRRSVWSSTARTQPVGFSSWAEAGRAAG
jgi:hypothetical protein